MSSDKTVYLVSGSNRGIGLSIVKLALSRPDSIIFAGARDPQASKELTELAKQNPERFFPVKLVSADRDSNEKAVSYIKEKVGRLDVVIANAGIASITSFDDPKLLETSEEIIKVNTLGPLLLFQVTKDILLQSKSPKFTVITSGIGSIEYGTTIPFEFAGYGASKAAVNWVTKKIHADYASKGLVAVLLHPGLVVSDMSNSLWDREYIDSLGGITPEASAKAVLKIVDEATIEKDGGVYRNFDGTTFPW